MIWHSEPVEAIVRILKTNRQSGLTSDVIPTLREVHGYNVLPEPPRRSYFSIFIRQFLNPLIYLLLLAAGVAIYLGDVKDAGVILVVVLLNAIIGTVQEGRAENSLRSLRSLSTLKARVLRNATESSIEASELLPGDLIHLAAGDAVPTDLRILTAAGAMATESALTGESLPVAKSAAAIAVDAQLGERTNMLYAGTFLTMGRVLGIAVATGLKNEIGKIASLTALTKTAPTSLEKKIHRFGRDLLFAAVFLFFAVLVVGWWRGISMSEIFMVAVSQTVSLVPEGLPVAMTVALAIGVQRMAGRKTIVRRLSAVESLGSVTTICTDKTGTLTRNEMVVTALAVFSDGVTKDLEVTGEGYAPAGNISWRDASDEKDSNNSLRQILMASALCNDAQNILVENDGSKAAAWKVLGDPTEGALITLAAKSGMNVEATRLQYPRTFEFPFDSDAKMMATGHLVDGEGVVFVKGAPESLLSLASGDLSAIRAKAEQMASKALRVLAIGIVQAERATSFDDFRGKLKIIGLVGQMDPPRSEVKDSIRECRQAGIRTVMITGDHRATAIAIARELDIYRDGDLVIDGSELASQFGHQFTKLQQVSVFARVQPAQKQQIVDALQAAGQVVAMTGDGVNDAPALAKADVGVAMGITGTEVAKEASKIVITDDRFSTIVSAIQEGRLVYSNIKKLILFLFVTSIDEVFILFLALIAGYSPPLTAVHILWINLVTEGVLTINLVMEPPEGDEMLRPPVAPDQPLLDRALLSRIPLMVIASVISVFGWFLWRTHQGVAHDIVQTETFTALAVSQWYNVLNCRCAKTSVFHQNFFSNKWLLLGLVVANLLHFAVIYVPWMNQFFHTVPLSIESFFAIGIVASLVLWVEEARKFFVRRKAREGQ
ncbi:MAG: HAD-IC family P-type ATPase [Bdellovibrionales bacterium]|nr:HAD-IC family P-type ATPase [Bdellovibrionales bacterium]